MQPLLERIGTGKPLIADGAMGSLLFARGLEPGECPEALNLRAPQTLESVAADYLDAGAQIIQTNTFGGSPLKLALYELDGKAEEINRAAVQAVRHVVGDDAYVSGSCGPSGKLLEPYGDTKPDAMFASFQTQNRALIEAGVDVICVETMTDLTEATLAIRAAKAVDPTTPVMATMTFDPIPRGFFTIMGVSIEQAAAGLAEAGADIIGSNCGNGIETMVEVAREFRRHTELPIIIQSNAGLPETKGGVLVYNESPEFMSEQAREMVAFGVSIIGGCCGTTPEHVRALRGMVEGG